MEEETRDRRLQQVEAEVDAFLEEVLFSNNPPPQYISSFLVDDKSGNTPELEAKGIFVLRIGVRSR